MSRPRRETRECGIWRLEDGERVSAVSDVAPKLTQRSVADQVAAVGRMSAHLRNALGASEVVSYERCARLMTPIRSELRVLLDALIAVRDELEEAAR